MRIGYLVFSIQSKASAIRPNMVTDRSNTKRWKSLLELAWLNEILHKKYQKIYLLHITVCVAFAFVAKRTAEKAHTQELSIDSPNAKNKFSQVNEG